MKKLLYITVAIVFTAVAFVTFNHFKPVKSFGATSYAPTIAPGKLGVGSTVSPTYQVQILSPLSANSGTTIGARQTTSFTPTGAAYTTESDGAYDYFEVNPATAVDSAASAVQRARYSQAINFSTHAVNSLYGQTGEAALGFGATGSINSAYGLHGDVINNGATGGVITNGFPMFSECRSTGQSTLSTCVGFYGDASYTGGTFSNYIGLKIPHYGTSVASSSLSALLGDGVGIGANVTSLPGSNLLYVQGSATSTASVTTGGLVNITQPFDGANLVVTKSGTASDTGRMVVFNQTNPLDAQDMFIASSSALSATTFNLKGLPTGKGILKIEHLGGGTGYSNGSAISLDTTAGDAQGLFIKTGTGIPINVLSSVSSTLFKVDNAGNSTTTGYIEVNGTATSTFKGGINLTTGGCFAINGTCVSGGGGGGSGTVSSGLAGQLAYYNAAGTTVVGTSTNPLYVSAIFATSTTDNATSTLAGSVSIGGLTSATRDNVLSVQTSRTYTNSGTAQSAAGAVNFNCTNNTRECQEWYTTTAISAVSGLRYENTNTGDTSIGFKIKKATTQFAGNLMISLQGKVAPSIEWNEDVWNGGTNQQGGGLFQITSHDNNLTFDARNNTNSGYCRQLDLSPDFSSTTSGTFTLFPCLNAGGSTNLGTGRLNINGTTTVSHLINANSTNSATEGDRLVLLEAGGLGISSSTPSATATLSVGANPGSVASSTIRMKKLQFEGENAAGTVSCMFVVGTTPTVIAGPCNN